jgi:toxin-antitoxin system PIN domain toxin
MASMILVDVNVLVYAHRPDAVDHAKYRKWLEEALDSGSICGLSDIALTGVVRIVTHPRIFPDPTPLDIALGFVNQLREHPGCVLILPGERHWGIFTRLCKSVGAKGNLVSDAFFAALAMESGAEWITADRDYARFPGLRWRHPLHPEQGS